MMSSSKEKLRYRACYDILLDVRNKESYSYGAKHVVASNTVVIQAYEAMRAVKVFACF